jgi:hypothetical protein
MPLICERGNLKLFQSFFKDTIFQKKNYIDIVAKKLSLQAHKYEEMDVIIILEVLEKPFGISNNL